MGLNFSLEDKVEANSVATASLASMPLHVCI